ncbi:FAD-binding oxidoreductase [Mesorhizobium sp. B2-3-5]|uniref:FAD-binding oxidoreductase n=1 Tax=Mesorhizobium sp. B2-3-5 TaxID=2589958 RepID=UPI001125FE57|nr:FAD-binding oxidoreductase [Mesorhizobium sp. B2-3-5]TPM26881.1 FAD-binding oxidoreductase [Mesorhizobium sp. B2-3-5]
MKVRIAEVARIVSFAEACRRAIGDQYVLDQPDAIAPYTSDFWRHYHGRSSFVVRPGSTSEVAKVVTLANRFKVQLVVQGGNTGLVNGGIPDDSGRQVVLSLGRLNAIRVLDAQGDFVIAEAGCVLADIQRAALEAGRMFPLSLGAEGSCQIGGNLATNAGGNNVLRYGSTRDLVLGLEVVLPDGSILEGLRTLRKDNTGYDLKQLFIGSEGTLGVITAAALRLVTAPRERVTLWLTVASAKAAVALFADFRSRFGDLISSFEMIHAKGVDLATTRLSGVRRPVEDTESPWHILVELGWTFDTGLKERAEEALAGLFEDGLCVDGTLAESEQQRLNLWRVREGQPEAAREVGTVVRTDVSVPISLIPELLNEVEQYVASLDAGVLFVPFGHVGDGNLHVNFVVPPAKAAELGPRLLDHVFTEVTHMGGSISAEHGVGRNKRLRLIRAKAGPPLQVMKRIKRTLDPARTLNAGIGLV